MIPHNDRGVRVTLPLRVVSESNARGHWAGKARRTKQARETVGLVVGTHLRVCKAPLPVVVTLTRIAPRQLDDDNLRGALKAARDGVADALGIDDRDDRVEWLYGQRRGSKRDLTLAQGYGVEVLVESRR